MPWKATKLTPITVAATAITSRTHRPRARATYVATEVVAGPRAPDGRLLKRRVRGRPWASTASRWPRDGDQRDQAGERQPDRSTTTPLLPGAARSATHAGAAGSALAAALAAGRSRLGRRGHVGILRRGDNSRREHVGGDVHDYVERGRTTTMTG